MNAIMRWDNCAWFSVGHVVFLSLSVEVLQNKDITCISLLKWNSGFGFRRCAVAKTVCSAVSNLQL